MYGNSEYGRTEYGGLPITSVDYVQICSESLKITESLIKKPLKLVVENLKITETVAKVATFIRALSESLKITEVVAKVGTPVRTLTETLKITEVVSKISTFIRSVTDTLVISETVLSAGNKIRAFVETVSVAESMIRNTIKIFSERIGFTDILNKSAGMVRAFIDTIAFSEKGWYWDIMTETWADYAETWEFYHAGVVIRVGRARQFVENLVITEVLSKLFRQFFSKAVGKITSLKIVATTKEIYLKGKIKSQDIIGKIKHL